MSSERKTAGETAVELVPQPHGGALASGGYQGNRGGRPPSQFRRRMRGSLEERLHIAEEIADDPDGRPADRIRALEFFAKYGLGGRDDHLVLDADLLNRLVAVVIRFVPAQADREQIKEEWLDIIADHIGG